MFTKKPSSNKDGVTKAIDTLLAEMLEQDEDSDTYAKMIDQLLKLYSLKEVDLKVESEGRINLNTLLTVSANLAGIVLIVGHERANVVTSKALTLLMKLK